MRRMVLAAAVCAVALGGAEQAGAQTATESLRPRPIDVRLQPVVRGSPTSEAANLRWRVGVAPARWSRRRFVLVGTAIGAAAGGLAYVIQARQLGDGDYLFPVSLAAYVVMGAGIGAVGGWLVGSIAGQ